MLSSLRFRLPALFLVGIVVSGVIASLIALRLFQGYARAQSLSDLKREARGLTRLYVEQAGKGLGPGEAPTESRAGATL